MSLFQVFGESTVLNHLMNEFWFYTFYHVEYKIVFNSYWYKQQLNGFRWKKLTNTQYVAKFKNMTHSTLQEADLISKNIVCNEKALVNYSLAYVCTWNMSNLKQNVIYLWYLHKILKFSVYMIRKKRRKLVSFKNILKYTDKYRAFTNHFAQPKNVCE